MILRSIWRIVVVSFAVLVSLLITAAVLLTLGLERVTQALHKRDVVASDFDGAANGVLAVLQLASAFTILPALALIVVGEVARIRSALYYVIGGGAAMASYQRPQFSTRVAFQRFRASRDSDSIIVAIRR